MYVAATFDHGQPARRNSLESTPSPCSILEHFIDLLCVPSQRAEESSPEEHRWCACRTSTKGATTAPDTERAIRKAGKAWHSTRSRSNRKNRERPTLCPRLRTQSSCTRFGSGPSLAPRRGTRLNDPCSQLRSATRRAKSDVANKLVSMFLHELSRRVSQDWRIRVDSEEYEHLVRECFANRCPYCSCDLANTIAVIEHLDGMNRYRAGLHLPGNVLVACRKCNGEKRRDDARKILPDGLLGWEAFLSHNGANCASDCLTCKYWQTIWPDKSERIDRLGENLERVRSFRHSFPEFEAAIRRLSVKLPELLTKLYSDCQSFAETEIAALLEKVPTD